MKHLKRMFTVILATVLFVNCFNVAFAVDIDENTWGIRHVVNAPASVNILEDFVEISYTSIGYRGKCTMFTLSNGSVGKIYNTDCGGINNLSGYVTFTTTGYLPGYWTLIGSSTVNIHFRVTPMINTTPSSQNWYCNGIIAFKNKNI